ncbi:methyl-CpG-binding domain-containing family protein [Striga asiatica]|uniref:Methyl-CpG-binding domain-containing family protein n=1 Tax=Striga asiatica TaxID=4170 RepID=A0A5A7Q6T0_STRAF|nr:methyl-CpG-binding domain-containing family protein [Striga asiatica]
MSEPQIPDPAAPTADPAAGSPVELPADPLLGSESVIEPDSAEPETAAPEQKQEEQVPEDEEEHIPNVEFDPAVAIAAQPISMLRPGEEPVSVEKTPRRRSMEEMSVRPSWLPEDWEMSLRVRASGNSAGFIDRGYDFHLETKYYIEPTGHRKFRSKNEVLHFLETGSKRKRRSTPGAASEPSENSGKQNKSNKKSKKSAAVKPDATPLQNDSNGINADGSG